jgi:hypothetical protein
MEQALHPRLVKRTFWTDKETNKDYVRETSVESMVILAESYNRKKDKFPAVPKKEIKMLDVGATAKNRFQPFDLFYLNH